MNKENKGGGGGGKEITIQNALSLEKEINLQIQVLHRAPGRIDLKKTTPKHIRDKLLKTKDKENILKVDRGN